ncbi:hypothetical protein Tco_1362763 [Tanacetum coccineum]
MLKQSVRKPNYAGQLRLDTSPKKKPVRATKGTRIKTKAKVGKSDKKKQPAKKPKANGLVVLSEVALTEAEQLKLATKRSKTYFHVSHTSGSSDGVDTQSKVPDEQLLKTTGADEGTGTIPGVLDVPIYESESEKESWGDSEEEDDNDDDGNNDDDDGESDDHDDDSDDERTESDRDEILDPNLTNVDQTEHEEEDVDDRVHTPSDYEFTDDEKLDDEETMDDEVIKELYADVNVNLGNEDTEMTYADQEASEQQNKADEPVQSSSVSSDFTSKLLNLENPYSADNEIASLMETSAHHATAFPKITFGFTTNIPLSPPFINPLRQQQTPTSTTTTTNPTMTLPEIPNFASLFKFDQRDEKNAYIELIDTSMRALIKGEVNTQLPQILPQAVSDFANPVIDKNVTESVEATVLTRSSSQPTSTYEAAASLSEFELTKILIDKMEKNKSYDKVDYRKKLYDALVESYNTDKDLFDSYGEVFSLKKSRDEKDKDRDPSAGSDRGTKRRKSSKDDVSSRDSRSKEKKSSNTSKDASQSQHKSSCKSAHAEEPSHTIEDSDMKQDQEFVTGNNDEQPANKEVTEADWFKKPERPPTPDPDWSKRQQVNFRPPQT